MRHSKQDFGPYSQTTCRGREASRRAGTAFARSSHGLARQRWSRRYGRFLEIRLLRVGPSKKAGTVRHFPHEPVMWRRNGAAFLATWQTGLHACMQVIIATVGGTGPRFYISSAIQTGLVPVLPDWPQALQILPIEMTGQHRDKFYQGEIMCPGRTIHYVHRTHPIRVLCCIGLVFIERFVIGCTFQNRCYCVDIDKNPYWLVI